MRRKAYAKSNQRFVMYIPNNLREEIENWTNKMGITLAEFGRDAFESYLSDRRREERDEELAETCRVFEDFNAQIVKDWSVTENENWPA
jgi:metal-responsive CopG/Arc/MetJ family transcriptional regulator